MRGVVDAIFVTVFLVGYTIFAPAAIEGVGEAVIDTGTLDASQVAIVESFYRSLFIQVPLVAFFGVIGFAAAWYLRRQATIQQR